jgi:hypothetical protein
MSTLEGLNSLRRRPSHRYRGHRADSFFPVDQAELVEIRARQRTFNGAYTRTAIGNLGYSILILKLFNRRFYRFGILFAILAALLFVLSWLRAKHSKHDFSDAYRDNDDDISTSDASQATSRAPSSTRSFGRKFVTAGWIVTIVTATVGLVEIGLLVLILKLD